MQISNIILHNKNFSLYLQKVKPFVDEYKQANNNVCPTWETLDKQFKAVLPNQGARRWFYDLVRRYNVEFKDAEQKQKNNNYQPVIGSKLKERFDEIEAVSGSIRKKAQVFTQEQIDAIVDAI